jgi:hypothetical protein
MTVDHIRHGLAERALDGLLRGLPGALEGGER